MSGYFQTQFQDVVVSPLRRIAYDLQRGHLRVPDFQRSYVWDAERKLDLLDSLRHKMPIGAVTIWRTHHQRDAPPHLRTPIPTPDGAHAPLWGCYNYILDGHQRLSTFVEAMTDERFLYDPHGDRFHFVEGEAPRDWMPVPVALDSNRAMRWIHAWMDDQDQPTAEVPDAIVYAADRAGWGLKDALVPLYVLQTDDVEQAAQAFLRLNRGGVWIDDDTLGHMLHLIRGEAG